MIETGRAAGGLLARIVHGESGDFTETGRAAAVRANRPLIAAAGLFLEDVSNANLVVTQPGQTILVGEPAAFTLAGQPSSSIIAFRLTATAGIFSETGGTSSFLRGIRLAAQAGAFTRAGLPAGFNVHLRVVAGAAVISLAGHAVQLTVGDMIPPPTPPTAPWAAYQIQPLDFAMVLAADLYIPFTGVPSSVLLRKPWGDWYDVTSRVVGIGHGLFCIPALASDQDTGGVLLLCASAPLAATAFNGFWVGDDPPFVQSQIYYAFPFVLTDSAGAIVTGATPTASVVLPGSNIAATSTDTIQEVGHGVYELIPRIADVAVSGAFELRATAASRSARATASFWIGEADINVDSRPPSPWAIYQYQPFDFDMVLASDGFSPFIGTPTVLLRKPNGAWYDVSGRTASLGWRPTRTRRGTCCSTRSAPPPSPLGAPTGSAMIRPTFRTRRITHSHLS
jgi:hypothetical protein